MSDITQGVDLTLPFQEGILFGNFSSADYHMRLIERTASTPSEKEKKRSLAYSHGSYDFSFILGERIFENRSVNYTFHVHEKDYSKRKNSQTVLENALMKQGITQLEDTFTPNYHFVGKAMSVSTTDDHEYKRLIVSVEFDCYPFKISKIAESSDIWDTFNFGLDVSQELTFNVQESEVISVINAGTASVSPLITVAGSFTIQQGNQLFSFNAGTSKNEAFRLPSGENQLVINGTGAIEFDFYKELI